MTDMDAFKQFVNGANFLKSKHILATCLMTEDRRFVECRVNEEQAAPSRRQPGKSKYRSTRSRSRQPSTPRPGTRP